MTSQKLWVSGVMKPRRPPVSATRDITRRPAGAVVEIFECKAFGKPRAHERERQILVEAAFADLAERHHLDQREIHAAAVRPFDQIGEFVLVHALERDRVDLDLEAGRLRRIDPGQHVGSEPQRVMARNLSGSRVSSETLMRSHAVFFELARVFGELRAVSGQRQFVERGRTQDAATARRTGS